MQKMLVQASSSRQVHMDDVCVNRINKAKKKKKLCLM